jgi:nitrogen fixation protein NifB
MPKEECKRKVSGHQCFSEQAHFAFGRIHIPVAPLCNIKCNYCSRKYDCAHENRPGACRCSEIVNTYQVLVRVEKAGPI